MSRIALPPLRRALLVGALALVCGVGMLVALQRRLMFFPQVAAEAEVTRLAADLGATAWRPGGELHGWRFPRPGAAGRLLAFHGNAGMAVERAYMAQAFGADFEVTVVEYPGFGARPGEPGEGAFFAAAEAAFDALRAENPTRPITVLGESIGSGSACHLAQVRAEALAGLILVTPFDRLAGPAGHHFPWLPVSLILRDRFENDRALSDFRGRVAFVLAGRDTVVPPQFGQALHDTYRGPKRLWVDAGADHNELPWDRRAPLWAEIAAFLRGP